MICSLSVHLSISNPLLPSPCHIFFLMCVLRILHFRLFFFRIICFNFKYESCMCLLKKKKKFTYLQSLPLVKIQTNNNYSRKPANSHSTSSSELIIHAAQPRAIPPCSGKQKELERVHSLLCNIPELIWPPKGTQVVFHADSSFSALQGNNHFFFPALSVLHPWALVPQRCFLFREVSGKGIFNGGVPTSAEMETPCRKSHLTTPWMDSPLLGWILHSLDEFSTPWMNPPLLGWILQSTQCLTNL